MNITSATFTLPSKLIATPTRRSKADDTIAQVLKELCKNVGYIAATVKQEEMENEVSYSLFPSLKPPINLCF